jgi:hypothetical protein
LLVCFGVKHSALDRSSRSCFYCLYHDNEFASTLVHVLQPKKLISVGRTQVRLLYYAWVDATAPKVGTLMQSRGARVSCIKELLYYYYNNTTPCLTSHLSFGQYIDCSRSFSYLLAEELAPTPFTLNDPPRTQLLQSNSNSPTLRPKFRPSSTRIMEAIDLRPHATRRDQIVPYNLWSIHYARIIRDI